MTDVCVDTGVRVEARYYLMVWFRRSLWGTEKDDALGVQMSFDLEELKGICDIVRENHRAFWFSEGGSQK